MKTPVGVIVGLWLAAWLPVGAEVPFAPGTAETRAVGRGASAIRDSPASLLELTDDELKKRVEFDLPSLGSLTIGKPGSAILINAVNLPAWPGWLVAPAADTWGTSETMAGIQAAVEKVHELFPDTQPVFVGDISNMDGGRMKRHESHQGGRDVDLGYYYRGGQPKWFETGTAANLDLSRNWALVRSLVTCTDVETILLDTRIQKLLYKHALTIGEDKAWLDRVFQFSRGFKDAIIRHYPRHQTHYHVRFYNPVAQELGRRAFPFLVESQIVKPPVHTVRHVVQPGQTLGQIASRYGASVRAIMQANGLTGSQLRAGRAYRIPVRATAPPSDPVVVPLRMLPPQTPADLAGAEWPTLFSLYPLRVGQLVDLQWVLSAALPRF
ncbi:MAG: penicillin-insensitive murein endopeptidase [Acidobacteriota bacterium]